MSRKNFQLIPPMTKTRKHLRFLFAITTATSIMGAPAFAETPAEILKSYADAAAKEQAGFVASATRGQAFFNNKANIVAELPSCSTCHTVNPAGLGKHAVTGKRIEPLAPAANAERFSELEKTEKWFKRNCKDVLTRSCTNAEKADFVAYLMGVKK